ncbi:hypothetical protein H0H92_011805 [Tricholoma furcatifolium]|nr:hypothetical protein H0H92_011805 [Tricholoma furcatifolium]
MATPFWGGPGPVVIPGVTGPTGTITKDPSIPTSTGKIHPGGVGPVEPRSQDECLEVPGHDKVPPATQTTSPCNPIESPIPYPGSTRNPHFATPN